MEYNAIMRKPKSRVIETVRLNDIFNAIIILIILIHGGFIDEIAGCSVNRFGRNMYTKYIIVFFIIYISIDLQVDNKISPIKNFINSIKIWILYYLFSKLNYTFTLFVICLLILDYVINSYKKYYYSNNNYDMGDKLSTYLNYLQYFTMGIIFIGFIVYLNKQYKDHGKNFNMFKFLIGTKNCS